LQSPFRCRMLSDVQMKERLCAPEERPCTPKEGILRPGIESSVTLFPKFPDRPGIENPVQISYAFTNRRIVRQLPYYHAQKAVCTAPSQHQSTRERDLVTNPHTQRHVATRRGCFTASSSPLRNC